MANAEHLLREGCDTEKKQKKTNVIFTKSNTDSRFEVLTLVTMKINTFWDMGHLVW
jgi:hypothetical protein